MLVSPCRAEQRSAGGRTGLHPAVCSAAPRHHIHCHNCHSRGSAQPAAALHDPWPHRDSDLGPSLNMSSRHGAPPPPAPASASAPASPSSLAMLVLAVDESSGRHSLYPLYKDRLCLYIKLSLFFTLSQKEFLPVVKLSRKSTEVIAQYDTWEVKT